MPDQVQETKDDAQEGTSAKAAENIYKQTDSGRTDLADKQKDYMDGLKAGKKSGVTGDFGKPDFFDSSVATNDLKAKVGDGAKPTGEMKAFNSNITRDSAGRPTEVRYADGSSSKASYEPNGNVDTLTTRDGTEFKKNGDHYDVKHADGQRSQFKGTVGTTPEGDVVTLNDDGTGQIRHPNGDNTALNADKSQTKTDLQGQLKEVTYPDGDHQKVTRDKSGKPTEVKSDHDGSWKKGNDGWDHFKPGAKESDDHLQDVKVKDDGTITGVGRDGEKYIQHTDGTEEQTEKTITRDAKDRPTEVKYPDGTSNKVEYDDKGPVKVHERDGGTLEKEGDHWTETKPGQAKRQIDHDIQVSPDGDFVALKPDGTGTVRSADGSVTRYNPDKSQVTSDIDGKVTQITYPDHKTSSVDYDDSGNPVRIHERSGGTLSKSDGKWFETTPNGKRRAVPYNDVSVSEEGDIAALKPDKSGMIRHRDGSKTTIHPDQSETYEDVDGNPIE